MPRVPQPLRVLPRARGWRRGDSRQPPRAPVRTARAGRAGPPQRPPPDRASERPLRHVAALPCGGRHRTLYPTDQTRRRPCRMDAGRRSPLRIPLGHARTRQRRHPSIRSRCVGRLRRWRSSGPTGSRSPTSAPVGAAAGVGAGAASDSRVWRPQLAALADELTVVAWDEPGAGRPRTCPVTTRRLAVSGGGRRHARAGAGPVAGRADAQDEQSGRAHQEDRSGADRGPTDLRQERDLRPGADSGLHAS